MLRAHGFEAERDGSEFGDLRHNVPGVHFEAKRQERLALSRWLRQTETDAPPGVVPVLAYRQSRQPWRVVIPAGEFLRLKALEREITHS